MCCFSRQHQQVNAINNGCNRSWDSSKYLLTGRSSVLTHNTNSDKSCTIYIPSSTNTECFIIPTYFAKKKVAHKALKGGI